MAQAVRRETSSPLLKEGFLCPICLEDQGSSQTLATHFETAHNTDDNIDVLDQVKGFFGKAKKFFALDDDQLSSADNYTNNEKRASADTGHLINETYYFEPQDLGKTRSLTDYFKGIRDASVDRTVVECNKLVIRLSKLTGDDVPEDGPKRRAFEQNIVTWMEDSSAKSCSTCAKNFNLTRRRHHCRLCGGIMCDKCSEFLPFSQARLVSGGVASTELTVSQPTFLRRSASNSSLNSIGSKEAGPSLRMCCKCRKLLELHSARQEQRSLKPTIIVLYEQLQHSKLKSEKLKDEYLKIAFSLCSGETAHSLERASALRQQLATLYNEMVATSKRIMTLKESDNETVSNGANKLQVNVRAYAISYIQECSATLPTLPDQKQYMQLVSRKEQERKSKIQQQLEQEKAKSQAVGKRPSVRQVAHPTTARNSEKTAQTSAGWKPGEVDTRQVQDDDPMVQQMNIIRGYLKQAKQAQRFDEVEMLEENLRHLEDEFYRQ